MQGSCYTTEAISSRLKAIKGRGPVGGDRLAGSGYLSVTHEARTLNMCPIRKARAYTVRDVHENWPKRLLSVSVPVQTGKLASDLKHTESEMRSDLKHIMSLRIAHFGVFQV